MSRPGRQIGGFTLAEVLVGLGLAAIVLGVVLQSATRDALSVSHSPHRYQALLRASQVLEFRMEEDRNGQDPRGSAGEKFPYDLSTKPVVTDPRVEQVEVAVSSGSSRESVSAYRLRVRRPSKPKDNPAATPSPAPSPVPSPATTGSGNLLPGIAPTQ